MATQAANQAGLLQSKKERLIVLENEISQAERSLENDFAKYAVEKMDEKWEDLFFDNKEEFIKQLLTLQNNFLSEGYNKLKNEREELRGEIANDEFAAQLQRAREDFEAKHPGVKTEDLLLLYRDELGEKYKAQLEQLAPVDFFEALLKIYEQKNGSSAAGGVNSATEKTEAIPREANAQNAAAGAVDFSGDSPMSRL